MIFIDISVLLIGVGKCSEPHTKPTLITSIDLYVARFSTLPFFRASKWICVVSAH